jgi:hypothetical protein
VQREEILGAKKKSHSIPLGNRLRKRPCSRRLHKLQGARRRENILLRVRKPADALYEVAVGDTS